MDSRKIVFRETAVVLAGQVVCSAIMLAVFALLDRFSRAVLLGGIIGALLATGNFFLMAIGTSLAADKAEKQDVKGGKSLLQMSRILRHAVLFVLLYALAKSGICNPVALVLPLIFVRPALALGEFFRKKGDRQL